MTEKKRNFKVRLVYNILSVGMIDIASQRTGDCNRMKGYSLIELIVFIVIIGLVSVALLIPLNFISEKSPNPINQTTALMLAQERMELIIGQRQLVGFTNFTDPCAVGSPPAICTNPITGFTVSTPVISTITSGKQMVVTVTGPGNSKAVLTTQVGNY